MGLLCCGPAELEGLPRDILLPALKILESRGKARCGENISI